MRTTPFLKITGLRHSYRIHVIFRCSVIIPLLVFVLWFGAIPLYAQSEVWSSPVPFYRVQEGGNVQSPVFITDSGANLHAFWGAAESEGDSMALYYSRWHDSSWSEPIDVLASQDGASVWPARILIDRNDYVHVFWGDIWHSSAHASRLGDARSWSAPVKILTEDTPFTTIDVAQDLAGVWYLVYSNRELDSVFFMNSRDEMLTWSAESIVFQELRPDTWIGYPSMLVAPDGALWVTWQEMIAGIGRSKGVLNSRSNDNGRTWQAPIQIIEGYYAAGYQVVDNIMVRKVTGGIGTGGRYVSFSRDNGATWTEEQSLSAGGSEGAQGIDLVIDSAGIWHFLVEGGMTFAQIAWNGTTWSPPDFVAESDEMYACCISPGGVTENAAAAISDGNRMHVIFEQDNTTLWYSNRLLDAPAVAPIPVTPPPSLDSPDKAKLAALPTSPIATQTPFFKQSTLSVTDRAGDGLLVPAWLSIVLAAISACIVIGIAFAVSRVRTHG